MPAPRGTIMIRDARIIFRNFAGVEKPMNAPGNRVFNVILEEDLAQELLRDGWNVKRLKPREDDDNPEGTPHLQVRARYDKGKPPRVTLISSKGRTDLTEQDIDMLDWVDIAKADLIINPYTYTINGGGIKAYLKSLFVTIEEDELDAEYNAIPKAHQPVARADAYEEE